MKITLIGPRLHVRSPNIWVPLGLTYIAATLERDGNKRSRIFKREYEFEKKC